MYPYFPPYPAAEGVSARVAFILHAAMVYVGTRVRQAVPGMGDLLIPLWVEQLINGWIGRRRTAILALIGRIEAGVQRAPRPYKPREAKPGVVKMPAARAAALRVPGHFAWLCVVGREVRAPGQWLSKLLDEDMREMVTAHPQLARLVRPVLRMTGEPVPAWFPKAPKRTGIMRPDRPVERRQRPDKEAAENDPSRKLARYIETERAKQYAASAKMLYAGCGGPPPEVARRLARDARNAAPPPTAPVPAATAPAVAAPPAEAPVDRDKYYYAETWNGRLIPVRRRWG
jgi:hypothetical protein